MDKPCTKCKNTYDISFFHKDKSKLDGLDKWCKTCRAAAVKLSTARRKENPDKVNQSKVDKATKFLAKIAEGKSRGQAYLEVSKCGTLELATQGASKFEKRLTPEERKAVLEQVKSSTNLNEFMELWKARLLEAGSCGDIRDYIRTILDWEGELKQRHEVSAVPITAPTREAVFEEVNILIEGRKDGEKDE